MTLKVLRLLLFVVIPGVGAVSVAQDASQTQAPIAQEQPEVNETEAEGDSNSPAEDTETDTVSDDNFVPTVQISEDLSVSFPVDI